MQPNYWTRLLTGRLNRRRAVAAVGAGFSAAVLLAACGNDGDKPNGDNSGLLTKPVDSSKEAKQGGVMKMSRSSDIQHWDPHFSGAWWSFANPAVYSRITRL